MTKVIAGVDMSLTNTGIIVLQDGKIIREENIKSKPTGASPINELNRIIQIMESIVETIRGADLIVIEGLAFAIRNTRSLVQLSGLNYMVRKEIKDTPFVIVPPTTLKKFVTGKGNSKKDVMLLETYKRYGVSFTDDNTCDAFGLAKIGEALLDDKIKLTIPQAEVVELLKEQII